jgi:Tetratricopeptide repeat
MIYGTADNVVPYGGGPVNSPDGKVRGVYSVWPAERLVAFFRQHNGCAEPAEKSVFPAQNPQKVEVERSTKCSGGPVHYYRVVGGRHNLQLQAPNPSQLLLDFFRGSAVPAGATIAAQPAMAAKGDDHRICFSGAVGDANVAACGRLIASNTLRGGDLVRAYMQRAVVLARRGDDYDRLIADASEVLRLDPNDVNAFLLRGISYQRKGDSGRAQADVNRALQLGPKSGLAYNALSAYYNMTGEYERALAAANESLRIGPGNLYGRKNRADSLENKGELEKALEEFRAVLAADPQRQERAGREAAAAIQRIEQKLGATRSPKSRLISSQSGST